MKKMAVEVSFDDLPDSGYVRLDQLIPGVLPFSPATLWRKVKKGNFPQPIKLSERITAWSVKEIRAWLKAHETHRNPGFDNSVSLTM